jgi:fucose permease
MMPNFHETGDCVNDFRLTIRCCYLGMFVQAIVINLAPVLFIPFKEQLGFSFEQIGRLILINFVTQVAFDLIAGATSTRVGVRRMVVGAHILVTLGLWLFAWLPSCLPSPYTGLVIGTVIFSIGGGVLELLLSPIINAVPSDRKAADMSLLHSFYAWGQTTVILLTALAVFLLPQAPWRWIATFWSIVPILGAWGFSRAPMPPFVEESQRHRLRDLVRIPAFLGAVLGLGLAGASEIAISQWISAFADKALHFPKLLGDLGGVCLFAAALGVGRLWFGMYGHKVSIYRHMIGGAVLATCLYAIASLSPWPWVSLSACVFSGLAVSLFWPGLLSVAAARFPQAGASMFALLSASGDLGAAVAPWVVGACADRASGWSAGNAMGWASEAFGLRMGLLAAVVFPLALAVLLPLLRRESRRAAARGAHGE